MIERIIGVVVIIIRHVVKEKIVLIPAALQVLLEMGHSPLKRHHKGEGYPHLYREVRIITKPMWDKDLENLISNMVSERAQVDDGYISLSLLLPTHVMEV